MVAQILAGIIFVSMFVLIVIDKIPRHIITLSSALLVIVFVFLLCMRDSAAVWRSLNLGAFTHLGFWYGAEEGSTGVNWATITFILGMMIMVEGLGLSGFFRWLCLTLAKLVHYRIVPLLVSFMIMSGVLAMFIDSITVVLFLATVTVELSQLLKFDPVPMIMTEIFCANLGGSATMCGDPPNIIVGTSFGLTFGDFLTNTGVIALICMVFTVLYFLLVFGRKMKKNEVHASEISCPDPNSVVEHWPAFYMCLGVFLITIVLLVTHASTGLSVATIGVLSAVMTILVILITFRGEGVKKIFKGIDYHTLLFFVGLFVTVSGLEETGVLELIANLIEDITGGNIAMVITIILVMSAMFSALVDNIPFAATMIPVVRSLATQGLDLHMMAWALSMGTDLGGNATPIGASANVVGTSVSAKSGHPITWGRYCKVAVPGTIMVVGISLVCLLLRVI